MPVVYRVYPNASAWWVSLDEDATPLRFPSLALAERRARFLAVRQAVRGQDVEIHVLDAVGVLVGRWSGERYEPAAAATLAQIAA
ncbi:hypothetical protein [Caulobacter sp. DWR1-3-2b1]|uniref:hypothetical protein n=1 Tax=Caulobacter sp. DWR1-3-2b1 TaxID=2804670 RepID=UPI003CEF8C73